MIVGRSIISCAMSWIQRQRTQYFHYQLLRSRFSLVSALNMKILLFVHFRKDHRDLSSETSWNQILNFPSTTIHKSLDMSPRQPYSIAIFVSNNSPYLKKVDFGNRKLSYFSNSTVKRNLIVLGQKTRLNWECISIIVTMWFNKNKITWEIKQTGKIQRHV